MKRYRKTYEPWAIHFTHKDQIDEISTFLEMWGSGYTAGIDNPYSWGDEICHIIHDCSCEYNCSCPRKPFDGDDWYDYGVKCEMGDWLVGGIDGCIYPVSDEVFRKTYEVVIEELWEWRPLHPGQIIPKGAYVRFSKDKYIVECLRQDYEEPESIGRSGCTEGPMIQVFRKTYEEVIE